MLLYQSFNIPAILSEKKKDIWLLSFLPVWSRYIDLCTNMTDLSLDKLVNLMGQPIQDQSLHAGLLKITKVKMFFIYHFLTYHFSGL